MAATTDDLTAFVREALARRVPRDEIRSVLLAARWPREKVERALAGFAETDFPIPVPRPRPTHRPRRPSSISCCSLR